MTAAGTHTHPKSDTAPTSHPRTLASSEVRVVFLGGLGEIGGQRGCQRGGPDERREEKPAANNPDCPDEPTIHIAQAPLSESAQSVTRVTFIFLNNELCAACCY